MFVSMRLMGETDVIRVLMATLGWSLMLDLGRERSLMVGQER